MRTIHASAVLIGSRALLVRGASGSGKSRLVLALIEAGAQGTFSFVRLVSDDRAYIGQVGGRLLVRTPEPLAGLLEIRGLGICRMPYEQVARVGWVVDLGTEAPRLPSAAETEITIEGVTLPRFSFPAGADPMPVLVAALRPMVDR